MGVELEIVPATWSTLIPGLEAKQYDVAFVNLFATPQRALVINFTEPYSTYGFHVVVDADSELASLDQLNNPEVSFVGMSGTVEESYPKELYPQRRGEGHRHQRRRHLGRRGRDRPCRRRVPRPRHVPHPEGEEPEPRAAAARCSTARTSW